MVYDAEKGNFAIALTGDSMLTRKLSTFAEPAYLKLAQTLRGADACFGNLESTVRAWDEGSPAISRMGRGTFIFTPMDVGCTRFRKKAPRSCCSTMTAKWGG